MRLAEEGGVEYFRVYGWRAEVPGIRIIRSMSEEKVEEAWRVEKKEGHKEGRV